MDTDLYRLRSFVTILNAGVASLADVLSTLFLACFLLALGFAVYALYTALDYLPKADIDELAAANNSRALSLQKLFKGRAVEFRYLSEVRCLWIILGFCYAIITRSFVHGLMAVCGFSGALSWILPTLIYLVAFLLYFFVAVEIPSAFGQNFSLNYALRAYSIFRPFLMIFAPLTFISKLWFERFAVRRQAAEDAAQLNKEKEEEVLAVLSDDDEKNESIPDDERIIIQNVFNFDDIPVSKVMTHRTDIAALPVDSDYAETMHFIAEEKYTRMPLYEENIDNIVGILHIKDLICLSEECKNSEDFSLRKIMRKAKFVPETKVIKTLFLEMQKNHEQLAIVIDEYGGTAGIVTLEDIVEEILGDISDEYDEEESYIHKIGENLYEVSGATELQELFDYFGIADEEEELDTASGLVIKLLDRIPEGGEVVESPEYGLKFKVIKVKDNRIERMHVRKTDKCTDQNDDRK